MISPVYLDASAVVKAVLREEESAALTEYLFAHPERVSSVIASVEAARSIVRREPTATGRVWLFLDSLDLVRLEGPILRRAADLPPLALRMLDAIHIASALELGDIEAFVTYDQRQAVAARAVGLPVASPGRPDSPTPR